MGLNAHHGQMAGQSCRKETRIGVSWWRKRHRDAHQTLGLGNCHPQQAVSEALCVIQKADHAVVGIIYDSLHADYAPALRHDRPVLSSDEFMNGF